MLKERLKGFIELTRIEHAFMLSLAVFISYAISNSIVFDLEHLIGLIIPLFIEMGAFALNDYLDFKTDLFNKRFDRPLIKGTISKSETLIVVFISFFISLILSLFLNLKSRIIAIIFCLLSILYDVKLKDLPLIGNAFIALSMAIPFVFGATITGEVRPEIVYISAAAFFIGMAREIIKSIEDMEGDLKARKSKTLPILIGKKYALIIALVFIGLFIPFSILAFLSLPFRFSGLILFLLAYLILGRSLLIINNPGKSRKLMLQALILGLLAYMAQSFLPL